MNKNNKKNKGFTLVELLLAAGVIALAGIAIYALYDVTSSTSRSVEEMKRLSTYVKAVEGATATNGNFSHINMNNFEDLGVTIDPRFGLSSIESPTPSTLAFTYSDIIPNVCSKFVSNVMSANMGLTASVNGQNLDKIKYTVDEITTACASDSHAVIVFTTSAQNSNLTLTDETLVPGYNYNPGNPGSIVVGNWGTPVIGPVVVGKTSTNIAGGGGGFGYAGGFGNIGNSIGGGGHLPSTIPPSVGARPPNPWDGSWFPPVPAGARISAATLGFKSAGAGAGLVRVVANKVYTAGTGLNGNAQYKVEYNSQSFNLTSTNPVTMGAQTAGMSEIFGNVFTDSSGAFSYDVNVPEDVTEYFGGQPVLAKSSPVFNFLRTTFKTVPVYVDVFTKDTNQLVAQTTIYPSFVSSISSSLVGKTLALQPIGGGNGAPRGTVSYITSYDGETVTVYIKGRTTWFGPIVDIPVCQVADGGTCGNPTGVDLVTLYRLKQEGRISFNSSVLYGDEGQYSYYNAYQAMLYETGLTYYQHDIWAADGDSTRVDQLTYKVDLTADYLDSLPMGNTMIYTYYVTGPEQSGG